MGWLFILFVLFSSSAWAQMGQVGPTTFPRAWNFGGVPQVNWINPITSGLGFLWVPIGGFPYDLVYGDVATTTRPVVAGPYGQQSFFDSGVPTHGVEFPNTPALNTDNGAGTGGFTMFVLTNASSVTPNSNLGVLLLLGSESIDTQLTVNQINTGDIILYGLTGSTTEQVQTSSGGYVDGNWHLLVGTVPGNFANAKIYRDGVSLAVTNTGTTYATQAATGAGVGSSPLGNFGVSTASIALAGAYNRVLTQAEVMSLYENPFQLLSWPVYVAQSVIGPGGVKLMFITSTSTWNPPYDWPGKALRVGCVGSGGAGALRNSTSKAGGAGGGGEYAEEDNVVITGPKSVTVGTAGGTTNSSFPGDTVTVTAHFGATGTTTASGAGGSGSTNTIHFSGGTGTFSNTATADGGGGAGGPNGAGGTSSSATGGVGDGGVVLGGAIGVVGNSGTEFDATHGIGSGGGGAVTTGNGFAGANYGGGGGAHGTATGGTAAAGTSGLCFVAYSSFRSNTLMYRRAR